MPKHIGIVACSPEGSALCYRDIFRYAAQRLGEHGHPTVSLHNLPLDRYVAAVLKDDWHAVGAMLASSAKLLAGSGAEFCIVPDNLMQHGVHLAEHESPMPWLTMTDLVTEAVVADKRKMVGLIGTKMVTYGSTYQTHLGLKGVQVLVPEPEEAEQIDAIIFRELLYGVARPESTKLVTRVIERLGTLGCEGVILASTEIPLIVTPDCCPLPPYDSTKLLAEGAVRCALGERPIKSSR
ncbi:MAG: amino acid racemase [Phycisphaerales bacterium]|nr:amino acid racemase [Phycisphaerales bacterium]